LSSCGLPWHLELRQHADSIACGASIVLWPAYGPAR